MNRKTRLFLFVSGSVLVVGVGVALLASYLGLSAIALGGADGPPDLKYVPADARVVAYADIRALMNSEARRAFLKNHDNAERSGRLESMTGINPQRDVDTMVIFVAGSASEGTAILARGRFDAVRIEGLMRERGGEAIDYGGKRIIRHSGEDGDAAVSFLEPDLLAFGSAAAVRRSIDLAPGGSNITTNDRMMGLFRELGDGNLWAVGNFQAVAKPEHLPKEVASRIPAITWFAARARIDNAVEGAIHVEARDDAAAKDLREVVQGLIAMGRLRAQKATAATTFLDSVRLGGSGSKISMDFTIPAEAIGQFAPESTPQR